MLKGRVRKFIGIVLCAVMVLAVLPLSSFAGTVDKKTASDPVAVLAKIEAMNLPEMPEALATELRGGGWFDLLFSIARNQGIKLITNYALNSLAEKYGWPVRFGWFTPIPAISR